jgi:hypothetical protein
MIKIKFGRICPGNRFIHAFANISLQRMGLAPYEEYPGQLLARSGSE